MANRRLIVGVSGASGAPVTIELLQQLQTEKDLEVHLICSKWGLATLEHEAGVTRQDLAGLCTRAYDEEDRGAAPASGSFSAVGMAVVPCSMKTLAGIVSGYSDSLLLRAADVTLKERRPQKAQFGLCVSGAILYSLEDGGGKPTLWAGAEKVAQKRDRRAGGKHY